MNGFDLTGNLLEPWTLSWKVPWYKLPVPDYRCVTGMLTFYEDFVTMQIWY